MKRRKLLALILSALLLLSMAAACAQPTPAPAPSAEPEAPAEPEPVPAAGLTPGTYTGNVPHAYGGPLSVEVTVTEDAITDIKVTENSETIGIGSNAIEQMPARILEHQSVALDTMTGCTISSASILAAVKDALGQAGDDIEAFTQAPAYDAQDVALTADVVVVGGGMAGLAAALSAVDEGAKVILLEKAAQTGGATATSGGDIIAGGTTVQEAQGIEDSVQGLKDYLWMMGEEQIDKDVMNYVAESAPGIIEWLEGMGVKFTVKAATGMPWMDPLRCHRTEEGVNSVTQMGGGVGYTVNMTNSAVEKGVEILYETPAQKLLMDGEKVIGVEALTKQGAKVTVNAKNVILATGGFDGNDEMMKEHYPLVMGRSLVGQLHNGDGHRMAEEAGAKMSYHTNACVMLAMDYGPTQTRALEIEPYGPFLFVLPSGERFVDESQYMFIRSGELIRNGAPLWWSIVDSNSVVPNLEESVEGGTVMKGETIAELAQNIGADPTVLEATVGRYNEMCANGKDTDFGKTNDNMQKMGIEGTNLIPVEQGPFYAIMCPLVSTSGTVGGPVANIDGQVINEAGDVIQGLYAAGEICNDNYYNLYYPSSGTSIGYCAAMGRRAGAHAAK